MANAKLVCEQNGLSIEQRMLDIPEVQSEDAEEILRDKLYKAYAIVKSPVIVSDDTWEIPALNGFPGPYMKSINHWLSPEDYLRLTRPLEDRTIYLVQHLGFTDGTNVKIFVTKTKGTLLKEARGTYGAANHKLVSLDGDNGLSIAEIYDKGLNQVKRYPAEIWHDFSAWFIAREK